MDSRLLRVVIGLVITVSISGISTSSARAQVSLQASPSVLELNATPGATGEETLTLSNQGDAATPVTIEVVAYPNLAEEYSAVGWVTPATTAVDLVPQAETPITLEIAVPEDAETGGAYARILVTTASGQESGGFSVGGQLAIAVLFEIDAEDGEFRRELSATQFAPTLEPDGRVGFRGEVTNTGNTSVRLSGEMELTAAGDDDPSASLQIESSRLLPSLTGLVQSEGTLPLPVYSEWSAAMTIYPGVPDEFEDADEFEDLEPVEMEFEFAVDPKLEYTASICENLDRGPTVTLDLANTGSIGLVPEVFINLTTTSGSSVASITPEGATVAWPGERTVTPIEGLEQLAGGNYILSVSANIVQGLDPVLVEVPFSIGGFGENVAPLCGSEPAATPDE